MRLNLSRFLISACFNRVRRTKISDFLRGSECVGQFIHSVARARLIELICCKWDSNKLLLNSNRLPVLWNLEIHTINRKNGYTKCIDLEYSPIHSSFQFRWHGEVAVPHWHVGSGYSTAHGSSSILKNESKHKHVAYEVA